SEEHKSELQSLTNLVCRLLLAKTIGSFVVTSPRSKDGTVPGPIAHLDEMYLRDGIPEVIAQVIASGLAPRKWRERCKCMNKRRCLVIPSFPPLLNRLRA